MPESTPTMPRRISSTSSATQFDDNTNANIETFSRVNPPALNTKTSNLSLQLGRQADEVSSRAATADQSGKDGVTLKPVSTVAVSKVPATRLKDESPSEEAEKMHKDREKSLANW